MGAARRDFRYGTDGQRTRSWGADGARVYLPGYEHRTDTGETKVYVGDYAVISKVGATRKVEYLLKDRLGSVDAITSDTGTVTETRGYDAFGKPRSGTWADLAPPKLQSVATTPKGFTQHEHLNQLELIHMNGRAFDYNLGRFTGVDPFIQFPLNSQSLNPYSYILNNPLSGTDPTGYIIDSCAPNVDTHIKSCEAITVRDSQTGETATGRANAGTFENFAKRAVESGMGTLSNGDSGGQSQGSSKTTSHSSWSNNMYAGGKDTPAAAPNLMEQRRQNCAAIDGCAGASEFGQNFYRATETGTGMVEDGAEYAYENKEEFAILLLLNNLAGRAGGAVVAAGSKLKSWGSTVGRWLKWGDEAAEGAATLRGAGQGASAVANSVVSPNRLNHVFGKAEHALDDLVAAHGSQEAAFTAVQRAANQALSAGKLTPNAKGILPTGDAGYIIDVAGLQVRLIGGRVVDGVVELSSFSRKGL